MKSTLTLSPAEFVRPMNRRRGARIVALSIMLMALTAAGMLAGSRDSQAQTNAQQPDYSQVKDFLNGQKHLLRNDDLIINWTGEAFVQGSGGGFYQSAGSFSAATLHSNLMVQQIPSVPSTIPGCAPPLVLLFLPPIFLSTKR
jgi:hypothetical protein